LMIFGFCFQESKVGSLTEDKSHLEERLEDVLERLKAARTSTNVEEAYRQEVRAQSKLADLYKGKKTCTHFCLSY
jgi:hypothetical protein